MKPPPKALRDIWAQVPEVDCKGHCSEACSGVIPATKQEREQIGRPLKSRGNFTCSLLRNGRCTAYSIRPVICRIWGTTEKTRCPHGCEPERWLSDEEFKSLMEQALALSGETVEQAMERALNGATETERALLETYGRHRIGAA